jgi:hypothetical protein
MWSIQAQTPATVAHVQRHVSTALLFRIDPDALIALRLSGTYMLTPARVSPGEGCHRVMQHAVRYLNFSLPWTNV